MKGNSLKFGKKSGKPSHKAALTNGSEDFYHRNEKKTQCLMLIVMIDK